MTVYQRIEAVFDQAAGPLRSRDVCDALDLGAEARFVEAMRSKLKHLVTDGVLVEVGPGLFARAGTGAVAWAHTGARTSPLGMSLSRRQVWSR
ncbi:hypothetical protein [Kitasatospora sp. GP82]|uniref:hypothetical protein n=1 Tax=Kitasatospora sp. GP82 TaxID=3035089 RepID=UPI0024750D4A|nr:hypothetical protein [Kitasatospora sp. GP82]